ncbi:PAXX protein, partial [Bucorvus abyssinicus]|nr:PAXX protein [Bucorvus abyssinicus]
LGPGPPSPRPVRRREALERGAAALSLGEGKATLQPREQARCSARCSALELFKLPVAEARSQLQALVFGMVGCVESLERRLEGPWWGLGAGRARRRVGSSLSPFAISVLPEADPSPRKNRGTGSALPAKRKIPGESLINPGFKRWVLPPGLCWGWA